MNFLNKVVLVTGAGSGFGRAIAVNFAKLSATLSLVDINGEDLEECVEQCKKLNGGHVLKHVVDLRNDDLIEKAVNETVKEFGKIDVVINCAGVYRNHHGSILDPKAMEDYDTVMAVNLRGLVRMTNVAAPFLVKSKGCIINISSIAAVLASPDSFAYFTSKAAVTHFTKCIALELAEYGVRANAILPGASNTNIFMSSGMSQTINDELMEGVRKQTPLKNLIEPKEIADMAVYLASDYAKNITGGEFKIDGGLTLRNYEVPFPK